MCHAIVPYHMLQVWWKIDFDEDVMDDLFSECRSLWAEIYIRRSVVLFNFKHIMATEEVRHAEIYSEDMSDVTDHSA